MSAPLADQVFDERSQSLPDTSSSPAVLVTLGEVDTESPAPTPPSTEPSKVQPSA